MDGNHVEKVKEINDEVREVINSEVEYAVELWDTLPRSERPLKDSEKPVEFWVMHMGRYLRQAEDGCYGLDKTPALEAIRKIAALCVRCMTYNKTPKRRVSDREIIVRVKKVYDPDLSVEEREALVSWILWSDHVEPYHISRAFVLSAQERAGNKGGG